MESLKINDYLEKIQEDIDSREFHETNAETWAKRLKGLLNGYQGHEGSTETTITTYLIKCVSLYIQYLFTISFLKKDEQKQILISRRYLCIVKEMLQSNLNTALLRGSLSEILTITITQYSQNWCVKKEILKLILDFVKRSNQQEIKLIMESLPNYTFCKLFEGVGANSDYDLESIIIEIMIRIYGQDKVNSELESLVPESEEASQNCGSITLRTFDEDIRNFLNIFNKRCEYSLVFSLLCKDIQLEGRSLGTNVWLDFNMRSHTISWYCSKSHFEPNIFQYDTDRCLIIVFRSNIHDIDITKGDPDYTFVITLTKPCKSDNEETPIIVENSSTIAATFESTEESKTLLSQFLPKFMKEQSISESYFGDMLPDGVFDHISCEKQSGITCFNPFVEPSLSLSFQSTIGDVDPTIQPKEFLYEDLIEAENDISQLQSLTQCNEWGKSSNKDRNTRIEKCSTNFYSALETQSNEENTEYETAKSRFSVNERDGIPKTSRIQEFIEIDFRRNPSEELNMDCLYCLDGNSRNEFNLNLNLSQPEEDREISNGIKAAEMSQMEFNQNKETDVTFAIDLNLKKGECIPTNQTSDLAPSLKKVLTNEKEKKTIPIEKHGAGNIFMSTTSEFLYGFEGTRVSKEVPLDIFEKKNEKRDRPTKDIKILKTSTVIQNKENHSHEYDGISKRDDILKKPVERSKAPSLTEEEKTKEGTSIDSKKQLHRRGEKDKELSMLQSHSKVEKKGTHKEDTLKTSSMNPKERGHESRDGSRKLKKVSKQYDQNAIDEATGIKEKEKITKEHNENMNIFNENIYKLEKPIEAKEKYILESLTLIKTGDGSSKEDISNTLKEKNYFLEKDKVESKASTPRETETLRETLKTSFVKKNDDDSNNKDCSKKTNKVNKKLDQNALNGSAGIVKKKEEPVKEHDKNVNIFKVDDTPTVQMPIEAKGKKILKQLSLMSIDDKPAGVIKEKENRVKLYNDKENILKPDIISNMRKHIETHVLKLSTHYNTEKETSEKVISIESKKNNEFLKESKAEYKALTPRETETPKEALKKVKKNYDDSHHKDGSKKNQKKEKSIEEHDKNVNIFKIDDTSTVQRSIEEMEKKISKPMSPIRTEAEKIKKGITGESKNKNGSLKDDNENSNTPAALKTQEKKTVSETFKTNFIKTKEGGAENKDDSIKQKKVIENQKTLMAGTTIEKSVEEFDESVNVVTKGDIVKSPILSTTIENILQSSTLVNTKDGICSDCIEDNGYIEDDAELVLIGSKAEENSSLSENVKKLKSPSFIKTKQCKTNLDEISRIQIPTKGSKQILKLPSVLSVTKEKLSLVSWQCEMTTEHIEDSSNEVRNSNIVNDRSSEKLEAGDNVIEETARGLNSLSLIKTKEHDTVHYEGRKIASNTQICTEAKKGNIEKDIKDKDFGTMLKGKKSKKISSILKRPSSIMRKTRNKTALSEAFKNQITLQKLDESDGQIQETQIITEADVATMETEDVIKVPKKKKEKRDINEDDEQRQRKTESMQASPVIKRKMKSKTTEGVNLFLRIKQNILKEKRRKRKMKLANIFGNWRKVMASGESKKAVAKSLENKMSEVDSNQNITDSKDTYKQNEITTRTENLFDGLFGIKGFAITNEEKKFKTNPELVIRLEKFSIAAEKNFDVRCDVKGKNDHLADSSGERVDDLQSAVEDKHDMVISNDLVQVKTNEFYRIDNENVKYKDINEIQVLPSEPEEFCRNNQNENYNVRSINFVTTVEVHEVPNKVAIEQFQKEATRIPSGKRVNVECESEITKSKSGAGKIENDLTIGQRKKRKLYNPNGSNDYMDVTWDATPLPINTVVLISDDELPSKSKKTRRLSKIMKSQKKAVTKTKRAIAKNQTLSLSHCGALERSSTASNSNVSIYHRLISILGGCSSVTEYMQKKKKASANRDTSTQAHCKKSKPSTSKDVAQISSYAQMEHHPSFKRKSVKSDSKHSKKIHVLSDITLVPARAKGHLDGDESGLDHVGEQLRNGEDHQEVHGATHPLVVALPNVKHWVAIAISYEKSIVIRSQNYIGKRVLLTYFPTFFSSTANVISDVKLLDEKSDMLAEENIEILIITMDSPHSILTWIHLNNLQSLKLPVLSDINRDISKANNFSTHLRGFSLINPEGEQVYLIGYVENFALNIDKVLAEIKQF